MTGEEFYILFNTRLQVRQALCLTICRFPGRAEQKEDMLQEAWISIAETDPGQTDEFYITRGYRAAHACYRREYRYQKRFNPDTERKADYRRRKFILKKGIKKVTQVVPKTAI